MAIRNKNMKWKGFLPKLDNASTAAIVEMLLQLKEICSKHFTINV